MVPEMLKLSLCQLRALSFLGEMEILESLVVEEVKVCFSFKKLKGCYFLT